VFDRPNPLVYFAAALPISLITLVIGYRVAARYRNNTNDRESWAWGLGHTAMFGLIALILAFSYSRAADRFEARGGLVVREANAIRNAYLGASFLPAAEVARFRDSLIGYAKGCLDVYASVHDPNLERRAIESSDVHLGQLWTIASGDARRKTRNSTFDLTRAVIDIDDVGEEQTAAFNSHVPSVIIGLVALATLSAAFLFGLCLGRVNFPNAVLATIFCLLFSATFFTVLDLDQPQGGFIGIDVSPLESTLSYMVRDSAHAHDANVSQSYGVKPRPRSSQPVR
jgi:hypothetical protein